MCKPTAAINYLVPLTNNEHIFLSTYENLTHVFCSKNISEFIDMQVFFLST